MGECRASRELALPLGPGALRAGIALHLSSARHERIMGAPGEHRPGDTIGSNLDGWLRLGAAGAAVGSIATADAT
ncbi:MAG: hypothetical protein ABI200_00155 [Gaiellales bacterium]